ncbi:RNA binding protein, putative [Leishmania panamensis]|uniref:RNA binding protein, putative n=1 Tax=Leishmania panamensis TaxID=5679 RepID=A0A088SEA6_LEIPA|nr:RNA binding protein, putative [Leishmania panamensis]AIO00092.1 RNA binding protein, putative [Leishmania panamensis]
MRLRRTSPHNHHGRGGDKCGSSHLNSGADIDGAETAEDQESIRSEQAGRAKRASCDTPGTANLSPHTLSSHQPIHPLQQQQRSGKRRDSAQRQSSFNSSQTGSLLLNSGSATLPTPGGGSAGGNTGGRPCRSTSGSGGSGGDGVSPSSSRHLQPPSNHSHVNLFVRDLPLELNEEKLRAMFTPFGDIVNSAIMRNIHTGISLGTAFVRFSKHEEAMRAMEAFAGGRSVTGSKRVTVQWARREHDKAPSGDERRKMRKLFIRNVPKDVTQEMLMTLFSQYGPVKSVSTHRDTAAANAVSQPGGGGGAAGAAEADFASHGGHDSTAATGASTDDRRIAFVTFEFEGVAEQATAAVHNTMPFASCQGIPLMVKLAEDTPVRHSALGSNHARANNSGTLNGLGANGNRVHLPHSGSMSSGGSVGVHHPALIVGVPSNNSLGWSDLPITDYLATPMASPSAAQVHSATGLAVPLGTGRSRPLARAGALSISAGRSFSRAPQDGSISPALLLPRSFVGTTGSAGSPSGTPLYTGLTSIHSSSAMLPYTGQTSGSAQTPRQPVPSPTAFLASPTSASSTTANSQQPRSDSVAEPMLDGSQMLGSIGFIGSRSGSHNGQAIGSGPTDLIGLAIGDGAGSFPVSSYETQEPYTMLQQYGSSLALASSATAQPPLSGPPSAPVPGADIHPHAGVWSNHSNSSANASRLSYQVWGSYAEAAQCEGVISSPVLESAQTSSTAPLSSSSFQQSPLKALSLPQPRSSAMQQQQQQQQQQRPAPAEFDGSNIANGGRGPAQHLLIPQPRSNASTNSSVPLRRSAAAAAAAPSSSASRRANTLPPDASPPSCASTPQKNASRVLLSSATTSFTAGGGAHSRCNGTWARRIALEGVGSMIGGASNLRHGPRATSSSILTLRSGTYGDGGSCTGANSAGSPTTGTLAAPLNPGLAGSFTSNNTNSFQPYGVNGILGTGSVASHSAHSTMDTRGSLTMKYTSVLPAQPASVPLPPSCSPAPQPPSWSFSSELTQSVTTPVAPPTFTTSPLMEAAAKMLSTDDDALTADDVNTFDYRAYVPEDTYAGKLNYSTSYATTVMHAVSGGDPPLRGMASGTRSSANIQMSNSQNISVAVLSQLNSPAPAATVSSVVAALVLCKSDQLGDPSPHFPSPGSAGLLDDHLRFQWEGNSAAMSDTPSITGFAGVGGSAVQTALPSSDALHSKEFIEELDMMFTPSESRPQDMIALADAPTAASVPNMRPQPDAGAYWCTAPMRDTARLVLGSDMGVPAYRAPSTAISTPKDLSCGSTAKTLPGLTVQPPSRIGRSDDEDGDPTGWSVYPDVTLNFGWSLGFSSEPRKPGSVIGSDHESGSTHDGVDHLRYSQQLGNTLHSLYHLMSYDDASY